MAKWRLSPGTCSQSFHTSEVTAQSLENKENQPEIARSAGEQALFAVTITDVTMVLPELVTVTFTGYVPTANAAPTEIGRAHV